MHHAATCIVSSISLLCATNALMVSLSMELLASRRLPGKYQAKAESASSVEHTTTRKGPKKTISAHHAHLSVKNATMILAFQTCQATLTKSLVLYAKTPWEYLMDQALLLLPTPTMVMDSAHAVECYIREYVNVLNSPLTLMMTKYAKIERMTLTPSQVVHQNTMLASSTRHQQSVSLAILPAMNAQVLVSMCISCLSPYEGDSSSAVPLEYNRMTWCLCPCSTIQGKDGADYADVCNGQ